MTPNARKRSADQAVFALLQFIQVSAFLGITQAAEVSLPVRKVVLYKNGMGYFEHLGRFRDEQTIEIVLPGNQLDDVLKSLTVLDLGRGQITGVSYDSATPYQRQIGDSPIRPDGTPSLLGFLNQIRGAEVSIQTPSGEITGKLMSAEMRHRSNGQNGTAARNEEMSGV